MHRPLYLEGEAGVGKTALAQALARVTGRPLYRLQCYEGLEASQALYDWDFGRQLLHLRAAEAAHATGDTETLEASLYDRRFLLARPLLQALEDSPSVLLVDEVDRADDEFEAFLLEVLSDFTISVPELGTIRSEEHTSELQSRQYLVCRLLLEKKKQKYKTSDIVLTYLPLLHHLTLPKLQTRLFPLVLKHRSLCHIINA